ncbi:RNA polymerase Rpc34 [Thozetella sp. PMI_491]|nr:RNA polymerase Rpc34 [Thozetella sp. PMI_491]
MASTPGSASQTKREVQLDILKDALYEQATQHGTEDRTFTQHDFFDFGVIPNDSVELLVQTIQGLVNDFLFVATQDRGAIAWRWRNRDDAKKYQDLQSHELRMVYSYIDEAGREGMWTRTMKNRLKMHDTVMKQCLKQLEAKGYVRQFSSVQQQNKKVYIKAGLEPSEQATGGPWFTNGDLDAAFIDALLNFVFEHIKTKGAYLSSHVVAPARVPRKGIIRGDLGQSGAGATSDGAISGVKRRAADMSEENHPGAAPSRYKKGWLPLPAGYKGYPTVSEIAQHIHRVGLTKNTTLTRDDVQQLVDILVYDGAVEPITVGKRKGYRCVRIPKQDTQSLAKRVKKERENIGVMEEEGAVDLLEQHQIGAERQPNGLTEAPCGRCPVFDLCEDGGPVSASNCVYFQKWLGIDGI